jgi:hypothetical protein
MASVDMPSVDAPDFDVPELEVLDVDLFKVDLLDLGARNCLPWDFFIRAEWRTPARHRKRQFG